jgi:predicted phosphohydrolase
MNSFQIVSDIHIERIYPKKIDIYSIIKPVCPNLILSGDIGRYSFIKEYYTDFLRELCVLYKKVYFVLGNHEYFSKEKTITEIKFDFLKLTNIIPNLIILDDNGVDIDNTCIRLYGTTLWSKIPDHYKGERPILHDTGKKVNTVWFNLQHYKCLFMLEQEIYKNKKKLVVISHYPPLCNGVIKDDNIKNPYRFYYTNNLKYLFGKEKIHTWISGHTHNNFDFIEKGTRIVSNQYRADGYILDKVINID